MFCRGLHVQRKNGNANMRLASMPWSQNRDIYTAKILKGISVDEIGSDLP